MNIYVLAEVGHAGGGDDDLVDLLLRLLREQLYKYINRNRTIYTLTDVGHRGANEDLVDLLPRHLREQLYT